MLAASFEILVIYLLSAAMCGVEADSRKLGSPMRAGGIAGAD
jgi:hypothetical protein